MVFTGTCPAPRTQGLETMLHRSFPFFLFVCRMSALAKGCWFPCLFSYHSPSHLHLFRQPSLGCCLSEFSPGRMYIINRLGFVGCQSINQSEFNYQASDGSCDRHQCWWRAFLWEQSTWKTLKKEVISVSVCMYGRERQTHRHTREAPIRGKVVKQNLRVHKPKWNEKKELCNCNQPSKLCALKQH